MKKYIISFLLSIFFISFAFAQEKTNDSWVNNTGIFSRYHANKWTNNGLYAGLSENQELIDKRTKDSKTFDNGNGTNTFVLIGDLHYVDTNGLWQDISVDITPNNDIDFPFVNSKNKFSTNYAQKAKNGIKINYINSNFELAKNTKIAFVNNNIINIISNENTIASQKDFRTISYDNFAQNIDYQYIQLGSGIENAIWLKNKNDFLISDAEYLRIEQEFSIPNNTKIYSNNSLQNSNFQAKEFEIKFDNWQTAITFNPIVLFDSACDFDEIMKRIEIPEIKTNNSQEDNNKIQEIDPLASHKLELVYNVVFEDNNIKIYYDIPLSWLKEEDRIYPIFVDPTATIGYPGSATSTSSCMFYNTFYHDQRLDYYLDNCFLEQAGFFAGSVVSEIGLLCSATPGQAINNPRIRMINTTQMPWVTQGAAWTIFYQTTTLPTPTVSSSVWNNYVGQNQFTYTGGTNNFYISLSRDNTSYSSGGGNYTVVAPANCGAVGNYSDSGFTWPYDNMTLSVTTPANTILPATRFVYTGGTPPNYINSVNVVDITSNEVTISWNDPNNTNSWTIEYGENDFTPGTGYTITVNTNPATISNLSPNTAYTFYIYAGAASYSCSNYATARTECSGIVNHVCFDFTELTAPTVVCRYGTWYSPTETPANIGVVDNGPGSSTSRHTVHTNVEETDPRTGGLLHTIPFCAQSSVRLGNWETGGGIESITYEYTVNTEENELLVLKYAAVMEDPNHSPNEQPRFTIKFLNALGQEINPTCYSADFIASPDLGWNNAGSSVLWKDWTTVAVDLAALNGQTIYVELTTRDCIASQGAHYGYAYFTLTCGGKKNITVSSCGAATTNTFFAPEGFNYRWYSAANPTQTLSTSQQLDVSGTGVYYCDCSFIGNNTCTFTLSASAGPRYPIANFSYEIIDTCNYTVLFTNLSDISSDGINPNGLGENCETAMWYFDDGESCEIYSNVTHTFPGNGVYNVVLVSGLANNQCTDTISVPISFTATNEFVEAWICEGETYNSNGFTASEEGTYIIDIGCGNTRTLTLHVCYPYYLEITDSICAGEVYNNYNFVANAAGDYVQNYTTIHGCDSIITLHLVESLVQINSVISENLSCYNSNNGTITMNVTGGSQPYMYSWSDGGATQNRVNLAAGNYSVTVSDTRGCKANTTVTLTQPEELNLFLTPDQAICEGVQTIVQASAIGGVPDYRYFWTRSTNPNDTFLGTNTINEIPDTTTVYSLYVLDAQNCSTQIITTTVTVSPKITINSIETIDNSCYQTCDGEAQINFVGGLQPYSFSWGGSSTSIKDLCANQYTITITDAIGCSETGSFVIFEPNELTFSTFTAPVKCNGGNDGIAEVIVQGGTYPYTYLWSMGQNTSSVNLAAGNYGVTVTDLNNCQFVANYSITEPEALFTESYGNTTICTGQTRVLELETTGGTPFEGEAPYNYYWRDSHGNEYFDNAWEVSPIENTTYYLTVTDANGCSYSPQVFTITVNPPLEIQSIVSDVPLICPGEAVEIRVNVTGGNGGPYMMRLQDGTIVGSPFTVYPYISTNYIVTIEDMCGTAPVSDSIFIEVRPDPTRDFSADILAGCPPLTVNFNDLTSDSYESYFWNFGDNGFSNERFTQHTYVTPGTYSVVLEITDHFGCTYKKRAENLITVYPTPKSEFTMNNEFITSANPEVEFTNLSADAKDFIWAFGDGDSTIVENPIHRYMPNLSNYNVCLIAKNQHNCTDTACREIIVEDIFTFYVPSAFSPNGDGINDCFSLCGTGISPKNFSFIIYDRNGMEIFKTNKYIASENNEENSCNTCGDHAWNGKRNNKGNILETGAYIWHARFEDVFGIYYEKSGTVTLLR